VLADHHGYPRGYKLSTERPRSDLGTQSRGCSEQTPRFNLGRYCGQCVRPCGAGRTVMPDDVRLACSFGIAPPDRVQQISTPEHDLPIPLSNLCTAQTVFTRSPRRCVQGRVSMGSAGRVRQIIQLMRHHVWAYVILKEIARPRLCPGLKSRLFQPFSGLLAPL
jgi:hypothetical protein